MKTFHITKENLLKWYFEEDYTEESKSIKDGLARLVIEQLFDKNCSTITTTDIFENCNKEAIKLSYLEEFSDEEEREASQLDFEYKIILI